METKFLIQPKKMEMNGGVFGKAKTETVYTNCINLDFGYLLSLGGFTGKIVCEKGKAADGFYLSIGAKADGFTLPDCADNEAFTLEIKPDVIAVAALTVEGLDQGVKSLVRLTGETENLPCLKIEDYPDIKFRAVHTCLFRPDDGTEKEDTTLAYIKKMMLSASIVGYNHVFLEFWGMFPYDIEYAHHPEAYSRAEIDELVSYAIDKLHIRPIPAQNLTSHAGWSRIASRQHVALDQRPDLADMWIPGGWCFDTENEKTIKYLEMVMSNLLDTFRNPPYLHACCDKCFGFGSSEGGRTKPADLLFRNHINFLHDFLKKRGTKMVMWADMLYSAEDCLYWKCSENLADELPKDITMNIWTHNDPGDNWKDAAFFEDKGFDTLYSPFMQKDSIVNMVRLCKNRGSKGIVQTTWHRPVSASPYVIMSGAAQWCGKVPDGDSIKNHKTKWYD